MSPPAGVQRWKRISKPRALSWHKTNDPYKKQTTSRIWRIMTPLMSINTSERVWRRIIYKGVAWIQDWPVCLGEPQQLLHSRRTEQKFCFIKWKTLLIHLSTITKSCTLACSMELGIYLSIYLSIHLSIYPSIHPSIHPPIYQPNSRLMVGGVKRET